MATITVKAAGGGDYTTIAAALAAIGTTAGAGADDIVEVYNGTYLEGILNTLPSGTSWTHPFTLRVAPGNIATIKKTGERNIFIYEPTSLAFFSIIQGFILDGTNLSADQVAFSAAVSAPSSIRMIDCEFIHTENENAIITGAFSTDIQLIYLRIHGGDFFTAANAAGHNHGIYLQGSSSIVEYCHIYDCTGFGIHQYSSESPSPANNIIRGNVVHDCSTESEVAAGILAASGSGTQVYNNVVYHVRGSLDDGGIGIDVAGTGTTVYNNTTYDNSWYGIFATNSTNAILRNNIAYSNGTNIETAGASGITSSNNVTSDPLFVHAAGGDFRLKTGSPAINAGTNVGLPFAGSTPEAGAFEYNGVQQWNTSTKRWQIALADNSIISDSSFHCLNPYVFGDWLFMVKAAMSNKYIARQISTGVEYPLIPNDQIGGPFVAAYDGSRYVTVLFRASQGKYYEAREVLAGIFDTSSKAWKDFSAQPELSKFHPVGAPAVTNVLWVHNGGQATGFFGTDPGTKVKRVKLITPMLAEMVTAEVDTPGRVTSFSLYQRSIGVPDGTLGAFVLVTKPADAVNNNPWTVTPTASTEPGWWLA